jgi:AraC-like DNA-binding protein
VTFEKVLVELRRKTALHYLGGKKAPVNETAYLVGLSDPAAFPRAFEGDGFNLTRTNLCSVLRP